MGFLNDIENDVESGWNKTKRWVVDTEQKIEKPVTGVVNDVKDEFQSIGNTISNDFKVVGDGVKSAVYTISNEVSQVDDAIIGGFNKFEKVGNNIVNELGDDFGRIGSFLTKGERVLENIATDTYKIGASLFKLFDKVLVPVIEWSADHPFIILGAGASYAGLVYYNQAKKVLK